MEFDELKKIWDSQNNEPLYGFNEKALHNRILSKKRQAYHITNISEFLGIIANISAGAFILGVTFFKQSGNISMYFLSAWMVISGLYFLDSRFPTHAVEHCANWNINPYWSFGKWKIALANGGHTCLFGRGQLCRGMGTRHL